jgi:hypothetical protein
MRPITLILSLLFIAAVILFFQKPIPQSLLYHTFADQRNFFGINNFWNVMSNIPFLFIGFFGVKNAIKTWNMNEKLEKRILPLLLSVGIFTIGIGSAYYHYAPDNATLVWDRLPMTIGFMAFLALLIFDFCGEKEGQIAFWTALIFGVLSIWYWQWTEQNGAGDLRPYVLVQFFPMLILPFLFGFFPKKVNYGHFVLGSAGFYFLAKVCEHFDKVIFETSNGMMSGHSLKHFLAAVALFYIIKILDLEKRTEL